VTIIDLFIRDRAEWLRTSDGSEIRLDRIRSVNGIDKRH
jgi:hypothetical protein